MHVMQTPLDGALVVTPETFGDDRGFFLESWNADRFASTTGVDVDFVQDNHSRSARGVLRGLHYQLPHAQGKLVRCSFGRVWDVIVDLRASSSTLGQWFGLELSEEDHNQLWIPPGFAHGFLALTDSVDLLYKTTEYLHPEAERAVRWDDPDLEIDWPLGGAEPILSAKDAAASPFAEAMLFD